LTIKHVYFIISFLGFFSHFSPHTDSRKNNTAEAASAKEDVSENICALLKE
jgi:hypothetical protein